MGDVLLVVAVIAICAWISGTIVTATIGLLQIIAPYDKDDAKTGLIMFFLPFLWPLALARMIVTTILEVREDAKTEARVRAVKEKQRQEREIREAEERIAAQKAAEERAWEEEFHDALHNPYNN